MPALPIPAAADFRGPFPAGHMLDGYEFHVALGDLVLGVVDSHGVQIHVTDLKGWDDPIASTGSVIQRPAAAGGWLTPANETPRFIEIDLELIGEDWPHLTATLAEIRAAMPLRELVDLTISDTSASATAAVRQDGGPPQLDRRANRAVLRLSLVAPDPRRYDLTETVASTGLPVSSGGLSLPFSLPVAVTGSASFGVLSLTNTGDEPTPPVLTVIGPVSAWSITHRGPGPNAGRRLAGDAVAAGRSLVIDTSTRTALLDGTASRVVTGSWFELDPGLNELAFAAATYDPASRLSVSFRSTQ